METNSNAAAGSEPRPGKATRKRWRILQNRIDRARDLRRSAKHLEQAVWELLCTRPPAGLRFQRQHPIGPYFATFACAARKLAIEIGDDGACAIGSDLRRRQVMEQLGWRVISFTANEVTENPERIWREIDRLVHR